MQKLKLVFSYGILKRVFRFGSEINGSNIFSLYKIFQRPEYNAYIVNCPKFLLLRYNNSKQGDTVTNDNHLTQRLQTMNHNNFKFKFGTKYSNECNYGARAHRLAARSCRMPQQLSLINSVLLNYTVNTLCRKYVELFRG